jgi:hypothetical protein
VCRRQLFRNDWVVYCKRPFGGPEHVLVYLGAYIHRVAISNHRLVALAAELGRKRVSQTDPLQQAPQGRALCGLGTAEALFRRGSRGLPVPAIQDGELGSLI